MNEAVFKSAYRLSDGSSTGKPANATHAPHFQLEHHTGCADWPADEHTRSMARSHHCSRPAALSETAVLGAAPQRSHAAPAGPSTAQLATCSMPRCCLIAAEV